MRLHDRKLLLRLMAIQGVSRRELARIAGWKSHSYMNRLLTEGKGGVDTLEVEPAVRIARHFSIPVDVLFTSRLSTDSGDSLKQQSA